jgi:hypothetical protein
VSTRVPGGKGCCLTWMWSCGPWQGRKEKERRRDPACAPAAPLRSGRCKLRSEPIPVPCSSPRTRSGQEAPAEDIDGTSLSGPAPACCVGCCTYSTRRLRSIVHPSAARSPVLLASYTTRQLWWVVSTANCCRMPGSDRRTPCEPRMVGPTPRSRLYSSLARCNKGPLAVARQRHRCRCRQASFSYL